MPIVTPPTSCHRLCNAAVSGNCCGCPYVCLDCQVGGVDEYEVCAALESGRITKPLVAW
jgi:hypothetical protein